MTKYIMENILCTTKYQVVNLMDDLQMERSNHQNARNSLEAKTHEVEAMRRDLAEKTSHAEQKDLELQEQADRLAALDEESREAHRKNLELTAKIEEVMAAAQESSVARADDGVGAEGDGPEAGGLDEDAAAERAALLKKLAQAEAATKVQAGKLEVVAARVSEGRSCFCWRNGGGGGRGG